MEVGHSYLLERAALADTFAPGSLQWAQLEPGHFDVQYTVLDAAPVRVSAREFNVGFTAEAELAPQKSLIAVLAGTNTNARWFGADFSGTQIVITRSALHISTEGRGSFFGVVVDEAKLQQLFPKAPDALDVIGTIHGSRITHDPVNARRIHTLIDQALFGASASHGLHAPKCLDKRVYGTMIPLLAAAVERVDERGVEPTKCLSRRLQAVRRCEEYMREHVDATLSLLDLSQVSGMRSRSLINAFEAVTGYSPMDYLKRLRLNAVHRALCCADKARTRIIDVATEWGFWHMGHFTSDYHAMFGETPSQTLLRARA